METNIPNLMERGASILLKPAHIARLTGVSGTTRIAATTLQNSIHGIGNGLSGREIYGLNEIITAAEALTKRNGAPLNWKDVDRVSLLIGQEIEFLRHPPKPPTPDELLLILDVMVYEDRAIQAKSLDITEGELETKIQEVSLKIRYLLGRIESKL